MKKKTKKAERKTQDDKKTFQSIKQPSKKQMWAQNLYAGDINIRLIILYEHIIKLICWSDHFKANSFVFFKHKHMWCPFLQIVSHSITVVAQMLAADSSRKLREFNPWKSRKKKN